MSTAPFAQPLSTRPGTEPRRLNRRVLVVGAVVGLHVLAVWALQSGLLRRAVEMVVPVQVLAELIEPPKPEIAPPPPPAPAPRVPAPPKPRPQPVARPQPQPAPVLQPEPSPVAPVVAPPEPAPPAVVAATPAPPAPPRIELPSSSADYLNNPRPPYPALSRRMGEQGKVVVRVFIEVNGTASRAEILKSSGFERLDQTALQTVLRWRYAPGKRAGVPTPMWVEAPIDFVLN